MGASLFFHVMDYWLRSYMNLKQSVSSALEIPFASRKSCQPEVAVSRLRNVDVNDCRVEVHNSIEEIEKDRWDSLVGGSAITRSFEYLRAIQNSQIPECEYYYPVIYDQDSRIVAHACVYTVRTDFSQLLPSSFFRLVKFLRGFWPNLLSVKITECANPLTWGCSISVIDGVSRSDVLPLINDSMVTISKIAKSKLLVIRDFLGDELESLELLNDMGYKGRSNFPLARIRVRWDTYADYLESFRARYRKDIKRRIRMAEAAGNFVEVLDWFGSESSRWAGQACIIREKTKGFRREALPPLYYENMDRLLGINSKLLVINNGGERVAHGMVIFDDETTTATFFGRNGGPPKGEWFQLINEVIRVGIGRGSKYISLGLGSYDGKSILGADIESLTVYRRSTHSVFNFFINLIPDLMKPKPLPKRNLFKTDR